MLKIPKLFLEKFRDFFYYFYGITVVFFAVFL